MQINSNKLLIISKKYYTYYLKTNNDNNRNNLKNEIIPPPPSLSLYIYMGGEVRSSLSSPNIIKKFIMLKVYIILIE